MKCIYLHSWPFLSMIVNLALKRQKLYRLQKLYKRKIKSNLYHEDEQIHCAEAYLKLLLRDRKNKQFVR